MRTISGQLSGHARELKKRVHVTVPSTNDQLSGHARELKNRFHVTAIGAKEFYEHTPVCTINRQPSGRNP